MPYRLRWECTRCGVPANKCVCGCSWRTKRRVYVRPFWEVIGDMKERERSSGKPSGTPGKGLLADYPLVFDMLTSDAYESGKKRKRSTMLVMADGMAMKILIIDKDLGEQAWFAGETLDACFACANEQLDQGVALWQPARGPSGGGRTR